MNLKLESWRRSMAGLAAMFLLAMGLCGFAHAQQQPPDYKIHAGDELEVAVWQDEKLLRKIKVRPDGKFSMPLAGEVVAAGRSVAQIQAELEGRLKKYIPDPVVTVSVVDIQGNRIFVIGQVNKPGMYVMNPQLNVLQALSMAGGTNPYAALNDIIVLRGTGPGQKPLPFRYNDVSKGKSLEQNVLLESGDVIVVP